MSKYKYQNRCSFSTIRPVCSLVLVTNLLICSELIYTQAVRYSAVAGECGDRGDCGGRSKGGVCFTNKYTIHGTLVQYTGS